MFDAHLIISEHAAYLSRVFYGTTITLLALCILTLVLRVYLKLRPWRLGFDDLFIVIGFILALVDWALLRSVMYPTPRSITPATATHGAKLSFLAIPIWGLAMTCIKVGIALTFLRIQSTTAWKIFLYSVMSLQIAYGVGNTIFILLECRPLQAAWDMTLPRSSCLSETATLVASNVGASVNIATDILLSLAPLAFLRKLRRPLREKIVICLLMGMGLLASVASIMKAIVVRKWSHDKGDSWPVIVSICTWTILEQFLATFAACAPSLKLPFQWLLATCGVPLNTYHQPYIRQSGFGPTGSTSLSRDRAELKAEESAFPSTASYADLELGEIIELNTPDAIMFPRKSAAGSGKCNADVHAAEVPVHPV